ncbi:MAG: tyrosine-type recombinase/integrase [Nocardioides sp.]|nr:tyrosine-type recombinase/integrase [Nocardioides sp.]
MSVQRYTTMGGKIRYRARVKHHGREVTTRVFNRKRDAEAWEEDQKRRLRLGEWFDPRRGRVALSVVAADWLESRQTIKRNSLALEASVWRRHIEPKFGKVPVASITSADVSTWVGRLVALGLAPSTAARSLGVFRRLLAFAVLDGRVTVNVAAVVKPPTAGYVKREGQYLSRREIDELATACAGEYADVVPVLALAGLRWAELAGLQVGDRVSVPGAGLRLQRTVMSNVSNGSLFEDTLKNMRSRTVPLVADLVPIIEKWSEGKQPGDWLFGAPKGGPLSEPNWKRSVRWADAVKRIGRPSLRVHDLRHTCASLWLGAGADPKVVQRVLGHASAAMTMDLYGHLIDHNLWDAAERVGGILGASELNEEDRESDDEDGNAV